MNRRSRTPGITMKFVQDNHSLPSQGTLRGLHYQLQHTQGKLVRVTAGEVFDVAVDLRRSSAHVRQMVGASLSPRKTSACCGCREGSLTGSTS